MDQTPTKTTRLKATDVQVLDDENNMQEHGRGIRIKKPPPITPRRFTRFFTPRPRNAAQAVKTSRKALRAISGSTLNSRRTLPLSQDVIEEEELGDENQNPSKKRKFSLISSAHSTPYSRSVCFLPSSQDPIPSSPIRYNRGDNDECLIDDDDDEDMLTDVDEETWSEEENIRRGPRINSYNRASTSCSILSKRLGGRRSRQVAATSSLWQHETANFYSGVHDVNLECRNQTSTALPFSIASCHTNPVVALGDEDGVVRLLNTANADQGEHGFCQSVLDMRPHDNALMDIAFSHDDNYLATASGDQSCNIIDVHQQQSIYSLRAHVASVKRVQFQPGSGDKILASCGRDGAICLWDLRSKGQPLGSDRFSRQHIMPMSTNVSCLSPVLTIYDAHSTAMKHKHRIASQGRRVNPVPGRTDFSITSLTFLNASRNNLLATGSEVDTVIKLWDLRLTQVSPRKQVHTQMPISVTDEPQGHANHRRFGINSIALNTDGSRMFALARDHTIYAYSTSHLILGSSPELDLSNKPLKTLAPKSQSNRSGLGPIYGFRHPSLRVATFWPRLTVRKSSDNNSELLAVGSTDECAVLFPLSDKYHTTSARTIPQLHQPKSPLNNTEFPPRNHSHADNDPASRPQMHRTVTSSFTSLFTKERQEEDNIPIYYNGTPLIRGHKKEVTSLAWSTEGNLVTTSDDFTVRCWRENPGGAREVRTIKNGSVETLGMGWASVGVEGWDDED